MDQVFLSMLLIQIGIWYLLVQWNHRRFKRRMDKLMEDIYGGS